MFEEIKKILPCWGLQIAPEKKQRDYINYLGYKIGLQKIRPPKVQIRRDWWHTLNDFKRLLGDIALLWHNIGIKPNNLIKLNKTLAGDKDLNRPMELSDETENWLWLKRNYRRHMWIM